MTQKKQPWIVNVPEDFWDAIGGSAISVPMNRAAEIYFNATEPSKKRQALCRYLECLEDIIFIFGRKTDFLNLRPISELQALLIELENGERPDIFVPRRKITGRSPTVRKKQMWWANASYIITYMMKRGYSEDAAAKEVTKQLKIRGLPSPGSPNASSPKWKQLQSWRDGLLRGKKGRLARAWYDEHSIFESLYKSLYPTEAELFDGIFAPTRLPFDPLLYDE